MRPRLAALAGAGGFAAGLAAAVGSTAVAAAFGALVFVPLVALSVLAGIALWIPALFVVLGVATTGMQLLIAAAWAGCLARRPGSVRGLLPGQRGLIGGLGLLLAWLALSSLWARDAAMAWSELGLWLAAGAILVVVATAVEQPWQLRIVFAAFAAGAVASVLLGATGLVSRAAAPALNTVGAGPSRFSGAEGNPNDLAAVLLPAIVFVAALAAEPRRPAARVALAAAALGLVVAFAATESRGGFFAAGLVALVAAVLFARQRRRILAGAGVVAVVVAATLALTPGALHRVTSLSDDGAGRSTLWTVAWREADGATPIGVGLNNFRVVAPDELRRPGAMRFVEQIDSPHVVHDTYLELLAETGPIGLGLFLAVVLACLGAARRAARLFERQGRADLARLCHAALLAGVGVLAVQVFQSNGYEPRFWVVLALGPAALSMALRSQARPGGGRPPGHERADRG